MRTDMQKKNMPVPEILFLTFGEIAVSLLMIGIYLLLGKFSYKVVTGAALGSFVTVLNFVILSVSVNRAIDKVLSEKGSEEMTEEEAAAFAAKHQGAIRNAVQGSYLFRQILMVGVLILAFLLDWFDVLATLIPLLMFRPLITVHGLLKKDKKGV